MSTLSSYINRSQTGNNVECSIAMHVSPTKYVSDLLVSAKKTKWPN
jgi:hypothetical protein